jgi:hypothetical protein
MPYGKLIWKQIKEKPVVSRRGDEKATRQRGIKATRKRLIGLMELIEGFLLSHFSVSHFSFFISHSSFLCLLPLQIIKNYLFR